LHAELKRWALDAMTLTWPQSSGAKVTRERVAHGPDNLVVHIMHSGQCSVTQRGKQANLVPGDMLMCAAQEAYMFNAPSQHQILIFECDRSVLADRLPDVDSLIGQVVSGELAATRILRNFLLSLWREGAGTLDGAASALYSDMIASLAVAAFRAPNHGAGSHVATDPALARVKGIVEARLHDPDLSPSVIADQVGMPLRTLQLACAKGGITLSTYIQRRRLERACELLLSQHSQPVTAIAYDVGFNDCAYFTRRFHATYGVSPSEYRTRH
jgi:AraC-like DNA-binding protein